MRNGGRLRPAQDDDQEPWIRDGVLPFEAFAVGSLVPVVFESYGRILHPAWGRDGAPVRWETVARWSGRTVHPLAEFERLAAPRPEVVDAAPFMRRPVDGALPSDALDALQELLAAHTATPDASCVGVWEGIGWIEPWRSRTGLLSLQERRHVIFRGPLEALDELGWTSSDGGFIREAPSVIWPADRAWFVSSDVDQDSTFLGGPRGLLDALVADDRLEAWPVSPTDPITAGSDSINR
jgi:hypothetical protein